MDIVRHRINTLNDLKELPEGIGAEVDLRSFGEQIILNHEPFLSGDSFGDFLGVWVKKKRGVLILNPKEDGLEAQILSLLQQFDVSNFFFLDLTLPTIVRLAVKQGISKIAVRLSEYEPIEGVLKFAGHVEWVWVDSFSGEPTDPVLLKKLNGKFKTCLVSPELQGYSLDFITKFLSRSPYISAVCTKHPDRWGWK
ncbi:MAG TPA: hypothetical protein VJL87_04815 [Bdellovibrionota bacterium]|nr:hypothetical protein [Bdellovibrionota bacterium]